ncbi:MAG: ABC transporter substrate-binding protein [Gaiellaceae bacterium]
MDFSILGPIEAHHDGKPLALGGPKQRALLACLLLRTNEVVSRDTLLESLWGEHPPSGASRTLDSYISRLRTQLGADRLIRRPPGYLVVARPDELDLGRFDKQITEARARLASNEPQVAARLLREALALWRGPALADLLHEPVGQQADELEERRLAAIEDRIDADLACGIGRELVAELERLVRDHPLRERLLGQLMLALYRAGRHSEALAAFGAARQRLAGELGLEPSPHLRELEQQILRHDRERSPRRRFGVTSRRRRRPRRGHVVVGGVAVLSAAAVAMTLTLVLRVDGRGVTEDQRTSSLITLGARSGRLVRADELPGSPAAVSVGQTAVWVADASNRQVLKVDPSSGQIVDRIRIGGQPSSLAVTRTTVWVANTLTGTITRIDAGTGEITQTLRLGGADVSAVAFGPAGLWVADAPDHALVQIDEATGEAAQTATIDARPSALAVGTETVWVADHETGRVLAVDASSGETVATVQVGGGPVALVLGFGSLWVANDIDATVSRIDPATGTVVATIPVGSGPSGVAIANGFIWVANQYAGTVSRIDPRSNLTATIEIGGQPAAIAAGGEELWIGSGPSAGAHRGGTLTIATTNRFASIDPAFQNIALPNQFGKLAYDTLVTFQAASGSAGLRLVPDLAVSLPLPTNGGTTYAFRLRRGIRYSNGVLLRASDFRRAIERLFRVGSQGSDYFSSVVGSGECRRHPAACDLSRGIRTDDEAGSVIFQLTAPDPDFLYRLTPMSYAAPIPTGTPNRDVGSRPIPGTGPYRLLPWRGREIRFERNPYFLEWSHAAQPDGNPDAIVWRFYGSFDAELEAVDRGEADWIFSLISPDQLRRLQVSSAGQLHANPTLIQDFIPLNTHRAPFDDVRVRRALNLAVDRARIARMYGGASAATPICQPLPPGLLGYRRYCPYTLAPTAGGAWRAPDLARARRLVAASGTKGQLVHVWGQTDQLGVPRRLPAYVASVLRSLGYRTKLHLVPSASITYAMRRSFQLSVDGDWIPDYPKPSSFLPQFFGCTGGYSNGYVCDRELDQKMKRATALQLEDPRRAAALWREVDRMIVDRAYWVPTVNSHAPELVSRRLGNFQYNPIWDFIADQAWLR